MDILTAIWEWLRPILGDLPIYIYSFLLRANIVMGLPAVAVLIGFKKFGWRSNRFNTLLLYAGFIFGLTVPLGDLDYQSPLRPWLVMIFTINLLYLPSLWAFLMEPWWQPQKIIRTRISWALFILFIANFFMGV